MHHTPSRRYSIRREFGGWPYKRWVVRFDYEFLQSFETYKEAFTFASKHQENLTNAK